LSVSHTSTRLPGNPAAHAGGIPPILLLLFNRPDLTRQLIDRLARIRPERLFIAIDGPRAEVESDAALCLEVRKIVEAIPWPCEIQWLIRDENLGCGRASTRAITWFFEHVDAGIVLEDDIHPHPDYFTFAGEMLARHAGDMRIGAITGFSALPPGFQAATPYFFSRKTGSWGLATWRNRWTQIDFELGHYSRDEWTDFIESTFTFPLEKQFWLCILQSLFDERPNIWAYRLQLEFLRLGWLTATPSRALVENLGYRPDATNTSDEVAFSRVRAQPLPPPYPNVPIEQSADLDDFCFAMILLSAPEFAEYLTIQASSAYRELLDVTHRQREAIAQLKRRDEHRLEVIRGFENDREFLDTECARLTRRIAELEALPFLALIERLQRRK
jgi:hypothetical protein